MTRYDDDDSKQASPHSPVNVTPKHFKPLSVINGLQRSEYGLN